MSRDRTCPHVHLRNYPERLFGNIMASLYRWFSIEKPAYLPDPDAERTEDKAAEVREANEVVLDQGHEMLFH